MKAHIQSILIEPAYDALDSVRALFLDYKAWIPVDLRFQGFDEEVRTLPGKYSPPDGRLFLARLNGVAIGCVALRRFDATRCEMKRLFVRDEFRSLGVGRILAEHLVTEATAMGYASMVLDSLQRMPSALTLYETMGFREIAPYCHNPEPDAVYMEKILHA